MMENMCGPMTFYRCVPSPVDCIREAVLTVSPKRQNRGILTPTTPATQSPEMYTYSRVLIKVALLAE